MYDVLNEKWVKVKTLTGETIKVSLKEVILHSNEYKELDEENGAVECAVYKFLFTFFSDMMFSVMPGKSLLEMQLFLLENETISEEVFDKYIEICKKDGTSFDLFDPKRPFMQNAKFNYEKKALTPVSKLNLYVPSASSRIFFYHTNDEIFNMNAENKLKWLFTSTPFCLSGGSGYSSGVFGGIPIYTFVAGNNMFEMMVFNLFENIPGKDESNRELAKPYWRMDMSGIKSKDKMPPFSTYAGMFMPYRFVKLDPDPDVNTIMYTAGVMPPENRNVIIEDPFVSYETKKKKEEVIKKEICASGCDVAWKDLSKLFGSETRSKIVSNYEGLKNAAEEYYDFSNINVISYVTVSSKSISALWKSRYEFPSDVLDPGDGRISFLDAAVNYSDKKFAALKKIAKSVLGETLGNCAKTAFNEACYSVFTNKYLPSVMNMEDGAQETWKEDVTKIALDIYDEYVISKLSGFAKIKEAYKAKVKLYDKKKIKK